MIDLIVSQGRVADRVPRMIEGAARLAREMEQRYGLKGEFIGTPAPPAQDDWRDSLPQAKETLDGLARAVTSSIEDDRLPVLVSNTCSASLATLPVIARKTPEAVVLYIDGHGDFNTPDTTDTGYLGGMVLSGACGLWDSGHGGGLNPKQAVLVGSRDIDAGERELLRTAGVRVIPPKEATAENVLKAVGGAPVWIHIDWDVLEPGSVPADYTVPDGMLPSQIRAIFEAIPLSQLAGVELAEFNAPMDDESSEEAVSIILDMVAPVFDAAAARD
ncbi:arginase family protein [Streptomyces alboniger]|uniref:Arginase family protein n=2 Tax=Streptomyces alboniger TaxID=132473 RepID=A0A5J6HUY3_STRAD|nr:arginase family protein [Streptomyces alboniger]